MTGRTTNDRRRERLKAIQAREQTATVGPWAYDVGDQAIYSTGAFEDDGSYRFVSSLFEEYSIIERGDTEFITNAREDIPWLLELVEVRRQQLACVERELDIMKSFLQQLAEGEDDAVECDACAGVYREGWMEGECPYCRAEELAGGDEHGTGG